jgi:hypothetical protein
MVNGVYHIRERGGELGHYVNLAPGTLALPPLRYAEQHQCIGDSSIKMNCLSKRITCIVFWGLLISILDCCVKTDTIQVSMPLDENQPQTLLDNNYHSTNLDIKPFPNNLSFMFQYNEDDYYILFGGKEEGIVSAYINKNR